ncbi:uncharacterized protein LOC131323790 [Rhododendron vialii]|uniref:uncharacterized protein LOC131323790 n=1 Tax=Rhododendron vialii TaxID=182163 RepID=UPI00265DFAA0|nr:uncharacterized protein LOC131323790 [Rhododendron vialii]
MLKKHTAKLETRRVIPLTTYNLQDKKMLSFRFQLVIINALTMPTDLQEVNAVEFHGEGCNLMAVGSSVGKVLIYDLRSSQSQPMQVKDHMYGSPISNIKWHQTLNSERAKLITMDNKIVQRWRPYGPIVLVSKIVAAV